MQLIRHIPTIRKKKTVTSDKYMLLYAYGQELTICILTLNVTFINQILEMTVQSKVDYNMQYYRHRQSQCLIS